MGADHSDNRGLRKVLTLDSLKEGREKHSAHNHAPHLIHFALCPHCFVMFPRLGFRPLGVGLLMLNPRSAPGPSLKLPTLLLELEIDLLFCAKRK